MALRKPLVLNAGQVQQLQSTDTLDAPQSGGDVIVLTNNNAGTLAPGTPVYSVANDAVDKAKADAVGTTKCIGLVAASITAAASGPVMIGGICTLTTGQWDTAFGTSGGLTKDTLYYLSAATAGLGTSTAPTTVGQYVVELGIAISTTELKIKVRQFILL